jgi:epoxyqueuosine reductase
VLVPRSHRDLADDIVGIGRAAGLAAVGITSAHDFERAEAAIRQRRRDGLSDSMGFTFHNPARSCRPTATMPSARALVVGAYAYGDTTALDVDGPGRHASDPVAPIDGHAPPARGRIARYAWRDTYSELKLALGAMAEQLRAENWRAMVIADDNALVDREAAWRAGLGWFGKNANLLLPKAGSWFVLGAVLTNAPLPANEVPHVDGCGTCQRCLPACPTNAIVAPGVIDARRCLAWIAQRAGSIPEEYRVALDNRLYGCDDCQSVCPPNAVADRRSGPVAVTLSATAIASTAPLDVEPANHQRTVRPHEQLEGQVALREVLEASDEQLLQRYAHWYIAQRNPRWIRRNALIALGNVGSLDCADDVALVRSAIDGPDELLAEHATWAMRRMGERRLLEQKSASHMVVTPS